MFGEFVGIYRGIAEAGHGSMGEIKVTLSQSGVVVQRAIHGHGELTEECTRSNIVTMTLSELAWKNFTRQRYEVDMIGYKLERLSCTMVIFDNDNGPRLAIEGLRANGQIVGAAFLFDAAQVKADLLRLMINSSERSTGQKVLLLR